MIVGFNYHNCTKIIIPKPTIKANFFYHECDCCLLQATINPSMFPYKHRDVCADHRLLA